MMGLLTSGTGAVGAELGDVLTAVMERAGRVWNLRLTTIDGADVRVSQLVVAVLVLLVGIWVARRLARSIGRRLLPRLRLEQGPTAALQTIIFYLLVLMVALFAMQVAGLPLTVFTIAGGALALGIGFGSQNIVNNFISGLIILVERPIEVGHLVEVDGQMGTVAKIGARATHVVSYTGVTCIVPSSTVLQTTVRNWNLPDATVRSVVAVGVAYGSDTQRVREVLMAAGREVGGALAQPPAQVLFRDFGDNALAFELHVSSRSRTMLDRLRFESDLRFDIDRRCREAGVVIAFPQRDVHLDAARPIEVRMVGGQSAGDGSG